MSEEFRGPSQAQDDGRRATRGPQSRDDDVFDEVLRGEFGGGVVFELGQRGEDAGVIFQVLGDEDVHVFGAGVAFEAALF